MEWLYLDPGMGGLILQGLTAGVIGIWVFFRKQIGGFLNRLLGKKSSDQSPN
ncbi:MAG: hypothetical protein ACUVRD_06680 [Bacteroidia bacterium]